MRLSKYDQELLAEAYQDVLEEGLREKLLGGAAAVATLAGGMNSAKAAVRPEYVPEPSVEQAAGQQVSMPKANEILKTFRVHYSQDNLKTSIVKVFVKSGVKHILVTTYNNQGSPEEVAKINQEAAQNAAKSLNLKVQGTDFTLKDYADGYVSSYTIAP